MSGPSSAVHLVHPDDDVGIAIRDLEVGESVAGVVVRDPVRKGHKLAVHAIAKGAPVRKYGWPIGEASADIAAGEHVHSHNLKTALSELDNYSYLPCNAGEVAQRGSAETEGVKGHRADASALQPPPPRAMPAVPLPRGAGEVEFMGYRRADGRVGTRNEIWILCTVGCVARASQKIAEAANKRFAGRVDGVYAFTHPFGCSQLGEDLDNTRRLIAALAHHPNAGGVLVLGLGCENNQLGALLESAPNLDPARLRAYSAQTVEDEVEAGLAAVEELVAIAENDRREPCPLSDLVVGLKCGGSDGFSGITANPLVGRVADAVSAAGGTPVLTEIPEVFGAERLLMARATSEQVFDAVVGVVNDFKRYFIDNGQPIYENPSPGNIEGGITTLEEKSLGAVQKAGHAPLAQVLRYGEEVGRKGLALLEAPGADGVSSTALTAAGCTVLLFTTGRGTPLGFPAPTLKIASNSDLAARKPNWIDFDAGTVLAGQSMDEAAKALLDLVIATASGRETRAEVNGEREIAIWKNGVTL